jgi:hypothetical protein
MEDFQKLGKLYHSSGLSNTALATGRRSVQHGIWLERTAEGGRPYTFLVFYFNGLTMRKLWGGFEAPPIDRFGLSRQSARQKVGARTRAGRDNPGGRPLNRAVASAQS